MDNGWVLLNLVRLMSRSTILL